MERSVIRDGFRELGVPDCAKFIIGRAFARPGGSIRATKLHRRGAQHMGAAAGQCRTVREEPCRDLGPAEVFQLAKTQRLQPRMKRVAVKMAAELFTDG